MAKESTNGLGVGQRYGALLDTSEVRSNKTEGSLNEAVFYVTPDLNGRSISIDLPKNAVVIDVAYVDVSTSELVDGPNAPYFVELSRTNVVAPDVIAVSDDTSYAALLTNVIGGPVDADVTDTLTLSIVGAQDIFSGQATITVRYFNQRNI